MKTTLSSLALATVVASLAVPSRAADPQPALGDAAFVPYYTVNGDWVTGVHIVNTSNLTQVIKLRLRRAEDSLDILDFNLVLSPDDVWTATLGGDEQEMRFITDDKSCTAPQLLDNGDGRTYAPVFGPRLEGAQEGYIEVIAMGSADPTQPVAVNALHGPGGVPADCDGVRDNFFVAAVVDNDRTVTNGGTSVYGDTGNVIKVSYFLRDHGAGIGFGSDAVHFMDFLSTPAMTHQQYGLENFAVATDFHGYGNDALNGWDFPDVRGGGINTDARNSLDGVRDRLGAYSLLNEWSYHPGSGTATDWVVTFPGQYALVDFYQLEEFWSGDNDAVWDYREIPVTAAFAVLDREEQAGAPGGLNFSPSPAPDTGVLANEVNVIEWGGLSVLDSDRVLAVNPADAGIGAPFGWASIDIGASSGPDDGVLEPGDNGWCDVAAGPLSGSPTNGGDYCVMYPVTGPVPVAGFVAWERTFSEGSGGSYGYLVEHSVATTPPPGC